MGSDYMISVSLTVGKKKRFCLRRTESRELYTIRETKGRLLAVDEREVKRRIYSERISPVGKLRGGFILIVKEYCLQITYENQKNRV